MNTSTNDANVFCNHIVGLPAWDVAVVESRSDGHQAIINRFSDIDAALKGELGLRGGTHSLESF